MPFYHQTVANQSINLFLGLWSLLGCFFLWTPYTTIQFKQSSLNNKEFIFTAFIFSNEPLKWGHYNCGLMPKSDTRPVTGLVGKILFIVYSKQWAVNIINLELLLCFNIKPWKYGPDYHYLWLLTFKERCIQSFLIILCNLKIYHPIFYFQSRKRLYIHKCLSVRPSVRLSSKPLKQPKFNHSTTTPC